MQRCRELEDDQAEVAEDEGVERADGRLVVAVLRPREGA